MKIWNSLVSLVLINCLLLVQLHVEAAEGTPGDELTQEESNQLLEFQVAFGHDGVCRDTDEPKKTYSMPDQNIHTVFDAFA